jgi:hypothetical protein
MQHIPLEIICLGIIVDCGVQPYSIGKAVNSQRLSPLARALGTRVGGYARIAARSVAQPPKTSIFAEIVPSRRRSGMVSTASRQLTRLDWRIHDTAAPTARIPAAATGRASAG